MRDAITGVGLVAFGTIAVFVAAILALAGAILAAIYFIVRDAQPQPQRQSYRRHRPWNFK